MKFDVEDVVFILCCFACVILFAGEPDLMDAIISNVSAK